MKILYPVFLFFILFNSCNEQSVNNSEHKDSIIIKTSLNVKQKTDSLNIKDSILNENLLGVWGIIGEHKASFMIDKKKIFYLEENVYYSYKILNDSLNIDNDDIDMTFKIKLNESNDTLTLIGDEVHRFRRLEN